MHSSGNVADRAYKTFVLVQPMRTTIRALAYSCVNGVLPMVMLRLQRKPWLLTLCVHDGEQRPRLKVRFAWVDKRAACDDDSLECDD